MLIDESVMISQFDREQTSLEIALCYIRVTLCICFFLFEKLDTRYFIICRTVRPSQTYYFYELLYNLDKKRELKIS